MVGWEVEGRSEDEVVFLVLIKAAEMDLAARHATFRARRARVCLTCIHVFSPKHLDKENKKIHYHLLFSLLLQKNGKCRAIVVM
jgi:hypothetical protein